MAENSKKKKNHYFPEFMLTSIVFVRPPVQKPKDIQFTKKTEKQQMKTSVGLQTKNVFYK